MDLGDGGYRMGRWLKNWFSNMLPLDEPFEYQGIAFSTVENFYQAMKVPKENVELRRRIAAMEPHQAKTEARRLARRGLLRQDFHAQKLDVMMFALRKKFAKGTRWHRRLMETGDEQIVEANNWHDQFFGNCICGEREACAAPGENHLGKLLMELRDEFRTACRRDSEIIMAPGDGAHTPTISEQTNAITIKRHPRIPLRRVP